MRPIPSPSSASLPLCGIDHLLKDTSHLLKLSQKKVAFLTNQKTLTQDLVPSAYALKAKIGEALTCILTPEHGWTGLIAEGEEIADGVDPLSKLPIFSLYGKSQKISTFLNHHSIDTLIIDLQDVGLRCYTYAATCAKALEACLGLPLDVIICDRPNPLGPQQAGPSLDPDYRSLLAYFDVPFQHGKTLGKLLSTFNEGFGDQKHFLTIYNCPPFHTPYQYPWYPPSPNLPSWDAMLLYPALVLLEGTTISEGRGTPFPFTSLGAPGLNHKKLVSFLRSHPHLYAESIVFIPQRGKFTGQACQGARLYLKDPLALDSFAFGKSLLSFLYEAYSSFSWIPVSPAPQSEDPHRYFIDALMGTAALREEIEAS